jgi:hypothetical protein
LSPTFLARYRAALAAQRAKNAARSLDVPQMDPSPQQREATWFEARNALAEAKACAQPDDAVPVEGLELHRRRGRIAAARRDRSGIK